MDRIQLIAMFWGFGVGMLSGFMLGVYVTLKNLKKKIKERDDEEVLRDV